MKLLKREQKYDFEHVLASAAALGSFELDRLPPGHLTVPDGYLTIRSRDEDMALHAGLS